MAFRKVSIVSLSFALVGCVREACMHDPVSSYRISEARGSQPLQKVNSCAQVQSLMWTPENTSSSQCTGVRPISMSATMEASSPNQNQQEAGVAENDMIAQNSKKFFVARQKSIEVLDLTSRSRLKPVALGQVRNTRIFVTETQLVAISDRPRLYQTKSSIYRNPLSEMNTVVQIFDINQDPAVLIESQEFKGGHLASRLIDSKLVLALLSDQDFSKGGSPVGIPCDNLWVEPQFYGGSVTSIHTKDIVSMKTDSVAFVGSYSDLYLTSKSAYLILPHGSQSKIRKVDLENLHGTVVRGQVPGYIGDRWGLKELSNSGFLSVVSTERRFQTSARLDVLASNGDSFNSIAALADLSPREDVRSVRYIDDRVYIVTFEKTDPLHVIDLSNPKAPQVISRLEIPGFSTYLQPLGQNLLLGVGFGAFDMGSFSWFQGLQISLFDFSDPRQITARQQIEIGGRGSFSDVAFDPHALFHDAQNSLVGLPVVELSPTQTPAEFGTSLAFSGAHLYRLGNALSLAAKPSHFDLIPQLCREAQKRNLSWWQTPARSFDINRFANINSDIWSISSFGVRVHGLATLGETALTIPFPDPAAECSDRYATSQF